MTSNSEPITITSVADGLEQIKALRLQQAELRGKLCQAMQALECIRDVGEDNFCVETAARWINEVGEF